MEAVAFEQTMDRLCEEGYLEAEVHIQPVEVTDPNTGILMGYRGERRTPKKAEANKTLKKIYTVVDDTELTLIGAGGDTEIIGEGEQIELAATEYEMRNTCFFVVRPNLRRRSGMYRVALQFRGYKKIVPRYFQDV